MSAPTIRRPLRLALTPALLVSVLALSACGGGDDSTTTNVGTGAATDSGTTTDQRSGDRGDMAELQACLKKQGVELPERPAGQNGEPPEGMPEGGVPPEGGAPPEGGLPGGGAPPAGEDGEGRRGGFGNLSDADREKLQKAMAECGGQAPGANGRGGPDDGRQRPDVNSKAYQESINAYVSCVRKNGYDLPDPDFSGDGPIFDPEKVDQQDATFKKASKACQSELRTQGSGGSTSSAPTPSGGSRS